MSWSVIQSDARAIPLADQSVQCCVTSPPYWGLRDYGTATWRGGDAACDHQIPAYLLGGGSNKSHAGAFTANYKSTCGKCGAVRVDMQLGLEPTPDEYVAKMVQVFREVRRVLRDDATLWLNLGDSYITAKGSCFNPGGGESSLSGHAVLKDAGAYKLNRPNKSDVEKWGLKHKDLAMIPARVALALQADGWYLRSDIIWSKPNPMPESVTDRPTKAHEYIFLLSKSERYYYDYEAIREQASEASIERWRQDVESQEGSHRANGGAKSNGTMKAVGGPHRTDKQRGHSRRHAGFNNRWDGMTKEQQCSIGRNKRTVWHVATQPYSEAHFATYPEALIEPCIKAGCPVGGMVLDPFNGSGTTGAVAVRLGRSYVGLELNREYIAMARARIGKAEKPSTYRDARAKDAPLFTGMAG